MKDRRIYGRAFIRGRIEPDVVITIRRGAIADVEQAGVAPPDAEKTGALIVPGFVDLHIHGGGGADFMDADEESNGRILAFHARHGTTALAATTLSGSRRDVQKAVATIGRIFERSGEPKPQQQARSEVIGIHLEGPYISLDRAGAQDRGSIRPADIQEIDALISSAPDIFWMITIAPEINGARELIRHFRGRAVFSIGHTSADYAEAVGALEAGATHFTHLFNAMTGMHHREPGAVGAALVSTDATAELIADGIHVHPAVLRVAVTAMPHRTPLVTDAIRACGLPDGKYKLYGYDVTVADGAARLANGTLAGSVLTMQAAVKNMVELAGLPIETVVPLATEVPARIAGLLTRKGRIERGCDADLALLNDRLEIERVFVRGIEITS